jgi:hypothetical protein
MIASQDYVRGQQPSGYLITLFSLTENESRYQNPLPNNPSFLLGSAAIRQHSDLGC